MIPVNGLLTLAAAKKLWRVTSTDSDDDDEINDLIGECSDCLVQATNRQFVPFYETRAYDVPRGDSLLLDADLAELVSLTNGTGSNFAAGDYKLYPLNFSAKREVRLLPSSSTVWQASTSGDPEGALSLAGVWVYHDNYARTAWRQLTTLAAAIVDTTGLAATMTANASFEAGQLVKIGTELFRVGSVGALGAVTWDERGINGSTAATHLNSAPVYLWQPVAAIVRAAKLLTKHFYDQRFGQGVGGQARVTAAGVVITPAGMPDSVWDILSAGSLYMPGIG